MSIPTEEQISALFARLEHTLDEWDDVEYVILARNADKMISFIRRATEKTRVVFSRAILEDLIDEWEADEEEGVPDGF